MKQTTNRVLHITAEKCGSQWVRDVLTDPQIAAYSRFSRSGVTIDSSNLHEVEVPERTVSGPVYGLRHDHWESWKRPGDRAVVVLRDPRDILISLLFSWLYSHDASEQINETRRNLHSLQGTDARIHWMLHAIGTIVSGFGSWARRADEDALVLRYEALVADQHGEFGKIMSWLGWEIPADALHATVDRLSFETRSGRKSGQEDKFSHYRRGVAGDWRNHFTRAHGQQWEQFHPGFLRELGYETSDDWWEALPESHADPSDAPDQAAPAIDPKDELIATLEKKLMSLQQNLARKEVALQEHLAEVARLKQAKSPFKRFLRRLRGRG